MRTINYTYTLIFVFLASLCSCMSTRVYEKTSKELYEGNVLIEKSEVLTLDGKEKNSSSEKFYDFSDVYSKAEEDDKSIRYHTFTGLSQKSSKKDYDSIDISLMEYVVDKSTGEILSYNQGTRNVRIKDGKIVKQNVGTSSGIIYVEASGEEFSEPYESALKEEILTYLTKDKNDADEVSEESESSAGNLKSVTNIERVTVESSPNGKFIAYSIIGKPFVIAGSSAWNLVKCAGYALINFAGGYNMSSGKSSSNNMKIWYMPSYKAAKAKAAEAKANNGIKYYPEYHLPFTNNHIKVEKFDRDIHVVVTSDGQAETITPIETFEYDNTISVERSAKADAASTAATADLIGTAVTIPVSVGTWIGGFAIGIYGQFQK